MSLCGCKNITWGIGMQLTLTDTFLRICYVSVDVSLFWVWNAQNEIISIEIISIHCQQTCESHNLKGHHFQLSSNKIYLKCVLIFIKKKCFIFLKWSISTWLKLTLCLVVIRGRERERKRERGGKEKRREEEISFFRCIWTLDTGKKGKEFSI